MHCLLSLSPDLHVLMECRGTSMSAHIFRKQLYFECGHIFSLGSCFVAMLPSKTCSYAYDKYACVHLVNTYFALGISILEVKSVIHQGGWRVFMCVHACHFNLYDTDCTTMTLAPLLMMIPLLHQIYTHTRHKCEIHLHIDTHP